MEREGSILRSQEPSTGPYPEPYQSNLSEIHFNIVHPPYQFWQYIYTYITNKHEIIIYVPSMYMDRLTLYPLL
jgi:hypothetical protein